MWVKLTKQVEAELTEVHRLLAGYGDLLEKCRSETPTLVEIAALAALLHSFYNGIENVLKRIAVEIDGVVPSGDSWHRDLLDQVTRAEEKRPAAISQGLRSRLNEYLAFRHLFRGSLLINLLWERMRPLVMECRSVFAGFESEIRGFLRTHESSRNAEGTETKI